MAIQPDYGTMDMVHVDDPAMNQKSYVCGCRSVLSLIANQGNPYRWHPSCLDVLPLADGTKDKISRESMVSPDCET